MRDMIEKHDGGITVTLKLSSPWEARRLSTIFLAAADRGSGSYAEARSWRRIGKALKKVSSAEKSRSYTYSGRVRRPSSKYPNELDMDHVVNGKAPYPVLSRKDLQTVWPLLEAKRLSAREIGERLYLHQRTVVRYRQEARKNTGEETGK